MNKERLLKLADFLENVVTDKEFDFGIWSCGTTACAVGWAASIPEFKLDGLELIRSAYGDLEPKYGSSCGIYAAMDFFDLTETDADYLFIPDDGEYDPDALPYTATRQDVASRIRELCGC